MFGPKAEMRRCGGGDAGTGGIRFDLFAIVEDQFRKLSNQLRLVKGEWSTLKGKSRGAYPDGWDNSVGRFPLI